jgi:hypothetical protein
LKGAGAGQGGERGVVSASAGVGEADDDLGGGDWSDAAAAGQPGGEFVDDGLQLCPVGFQGVCAGVDGQGEAADLSVSDGVFAAGVTWWAAACQAGEGGLVEGVAGGLSVGVVAGQQQGA